MWEQFFSLDKDPGLQAAGVQIGAHMHLSGNRPQLRIVLRSADKSAEVACTHVVLYSGSLEGMQEGEDLVRSPAQGVAYLAPEEHFFALCSYVQCISESGLENLLIISSKSNDQVVGFNTLMQKQLLDAVFDVAPTAGMDLALRAWGVNCMAFLDSLRVRMAFAQNPHTPPEILFQLSSDKHMVVLYEVASNPSATPEILVQLVERSSTMAIGDPSKCSFDKEAIRFKVLRNPQWSKISSPLLRRLASDKLPRIRATVAKHPNSFPDTLCQLAIDENPEVRSGVAENPNTPPEILAQLALDEMEAVRAALAKNSAIAPNILTKLARDKESLVGLFVAQNPRTPPRTLARLAKDYHLDTRAAVAQNPSTPPQVLALLAEDPEREVRQAVTRSSGAMLKKYEMRQREGGIKRRRVKKTTRKSETNTTLMAQKTENPLPLSATHQSVPAIVSETKVLGCLTFEPAPLSYLTQCLNIKSTRDTRYLQIQLRNLESNGKIQVCNRQDKKYYCRV